MQDKDADPVIKVTVRGIGGHCEKPGCTNKAEDICGDMFLCRACIVGRDDEKDQKQLREEWLSRCDLSSSGGMLIEKKCADRGSVEKLEKGDSTLIPAFQC